MVDHEIVTAPSASVLAVLRQETTSRAPAEQALFVVADPVYGASDPRVDQHPFFAAGYKQTAASDAIRSGAESGLLLIRLFQQAISSSVGGVPRPPFPKTLREFQAKFATEDACQ
jgi:hypothetical protein